MVEPPPDKQPPSRTGLASRTSIATVSIAGDLQEKIEAIARAGFDGVEIFEPDFLTYGGSPREVGTMIRDQGLEITLFQPFRDFEGMPEPERSRTLERARRKFELMNELGADLMLVCSSVSSKALGGIDRAAADLNELGVIAAAAGIRVGYEALAWGRHVSDHRDAWEIVRRADHPSIGLVLDSFHTLARRIDPDTIRAIPGDRIFMVQLADAPLIDMDLLYWSRHFRLMPGEGDLPVVDFLRAVAATGYDGPLSLEIFNDQFRGGSPTTIAADGHRSLLYLIDKVARAEPATTAVRAPAMPARSSIAGIEFVEFAADRADADRLAATFRGLGFSRIGRHRTKAVELYRQGGINIVLNSESKGAARSSFNTHGTSAYAFGLRVPDPQAVVDRASVMGAPIFEEPVVAGDVVMPAVRGVGGGLIYVLGDRGDGSAIWNHEFVSTNDPDAASAGLTHIDHLAQTMDYDEMLTWVLFYRSIFEVDKSPMVDVLDPAGIVRSQVIEDESGAFRLTLNGAQNNRTFAGQFVSGTSGSSIQHLAFATEDVMATAVAMAARGFEPLALPLTYYTDLAARFGLSEAFTERLRSMNILYDRDDAGEFFHFYGRSLGEGFFIEVVQRLAGYRGYGAANAPFRIAAQKRARRELAVSFQ